MKAQEKVLEEIINLCEQAISEQMKPKAPEKDDEEDPKEPEGNETDDSDPDLAKLKAAAKE